MTGRQPAWAAAGVTLALMCGQATAQEVRLPGLVVEGATLSRPVAPRAARPTPAASAPAPAVQPEAEALTDESGEIEVGVPASEIGSAVTVVTGQELRDRQIRNGAEALRSLPGVHVSRTNTPASVTQVRIRGAEGNHTVVLIDGVVANAPTGGEYDFSDLSTADIERIEVIRGAQSVLYGSGAIGGAINIITRSGRGPARVTIAAEGGSFGTRDLTLGASAGSERIWGSLTYNVRKSNGFNISPSGNERDASELETISFRGGVQIMPGLIIDGSLRHSRKAGERDGFGGPVGQLGTAIDDPSHLTSNVLLGSVRARWETFGGMLVHEFRTTYNETKTTDLAFDPIFPPFFSKYDSDSRTHSYLGTLNLPGTPTLLRHTVAVLAEWNEESFTPLGDSTDGLRRSRDRFAFAGEWRGTFAQQFHVTAGVRRDDNSAFDDFTSWRATAAWNVPGGSGLRPHASVGTGFKAPSFFEQFGSIPGFFTPNPDLVPEESFGWDAGIEWTLWSGRLIFDVTYFQSDLENKIELRLSDSPSVVNLLGTSHREGVEVSAKYRLLPGILLGAAYTYVDATNPNDSRALRRPPHSGRLDVDARFADGKGRANFAAIYNGRMDDRAIVNGPPFGLTQIVSLDATWRLSAAVSYELRPGMEIFGRVENILDDRGEEVFGYSQPGVAAYAGMRITLGGENGGLKP